MGCPYQYDPHLSVSTLLFHSEMYLTSVEQIIKCKENRHCLKRLLQINLLCVSSQPKQIISTYLVSTPLRNQDRKLTVVIHSTNQNQRQTGSRHGFLDSVEPLNNIDPSQHLSLQCSHLKNVEHRLSFCYTEYLPAGSSDAWPFSSGLNHLRTAGDVPSMMIPTANAGKYKLFSIFQLVPILKIHRLLTPLKS